MKQLLIIFFIIIVYTSDPYRTLGVSKRATQQQIRKAFKQLSLKWHPDRNKQAGASSKYQQIINAYEILKDPQRRRTYDLTGETNTNNMDNNFHQGGGFYHSNGHNPFGDFQQIFREFEQQINRQRQSQYEKQKKRQNERSSQKFNEDEYVVHQYIDGFGNVRTVLIKKQKNDLSSLLDEILNFIFYNPMILMLILLTFMLMLLSSIKKEQ